jgi:NAD(P)-dependent dehydrogenase (short-subunit alcohol dehydrogenase family)
MSNEVVAGKVALVTGTSSGIGLYSAVMLAEAGYSVVATMRNTAKATALQDLARQHKVEIDVRQLDVEDEASVTACVNGVVATYGKIDLLVNNAGAGYLGSLEQTSMADLRRTMEVNFFGVWRMTQAVFPLMRKAGSGRIISVTSVGGLIGQPLNDAYCAAKFAVEGFMEGFAPVAKRFGVNVSLIEPGSVNTEFVDTLRSTQAENGTDRPAQAEYIPLFEAYIAASTQNFAANGQTPTEIGQVIVEAATATNPHFRYLTSALMQGLMSRKYVDTTGDSIIELFSSRLPK